jgi:hypothetical protein
MIDFREILGQCDLHDLGFVGLPWTYDNKQLGEKNVRVRLDRAIASLAWSTWLPEATLKHIASSRLDHCPIYLNMVKDSNTNAARHLARYEIMWEREDFMSEEIKLAWAS